MNSRQNYIDLIVKYLSGEITHDEIMKLESWMGEKPAHRNLFNDYKKVWESLGKVADSSGINVHEEWKKLKGKMKDAGHHSVIFKSPAVKDFRFYLLRIAAILVIGLFLGITGILINRNFGYITYITDNATISVQLPDDTQVTLNADSRLQIQRKFINDQRLVKLTGEAYFEVSPDPGKPFIINTGKIEIKVLGTSFNVSAYEDNDLIEVIVNAGQVAVTRDDVTTQRIILKPGNRGVFNKKDQSLKLSVNNDPNFLAWKTRQLFFEDKSLDEVLITLNKIYHSNVLIHGDSLKEERITASFNNQSLDAILNVLAATLDLNIKEINGDLVLIKK
jgi:ferric-dicitrate binding protein FerR (iron transport regulator)